MLLSEQIQFTINTFRETLPPELNTLIEVGAGEISSLPIKENAISIGDAVPEFELANYSGEIKTLLSYSQHRYLILTFYRGLWCPYCNLQLAAYNKHIEEFRTLGAELVAVSAEGPDGLEVLEQSSLPDEAKKTAIANPDFDVLHDKDGKLSKQFGLTFTLPDAHQSLLKMMEVNVEKSNGNNTFSFADPATYIVNQSGIVVWSFVPNNYRKRAEPQEIVSALEKLRSEHG